MSIRLLKNIPLRDAASRYLAEHSEGSPLYPAGSLTSTEAVEKRVQVLSSWAGNRKELGDWLREQNNFAPLHPAQQKNLEAAAQSDSLFIVTGQQPGLLGGPALWFYKAMTCVAWARKWAEQLGRPVIPIFWVAGDDSDLAECNAVEWLEPEAATRTFAMEFSDPAASIPMSLRMLPEGGVKELLQHAREIWGEEMAGQIEAAYRPGQSITESFLRFAQTFLGPQGVLFVDGFSADALAQPLLRRIVREASKFHETVGTSSRRLSQILSLPPQVPLRPGTVPVFSLEAGQRTRLFFPDSGGKVYLQGEEGHDLLPELEKHHLQHSALTRPLVVEEVFPVLGHVLGPAELRYFAQLADAFSAFGKSFPLLAPRQQLLACSQSDWKRLSALGLNPEDLPQFGPSRLRALLVEKAWEKHPAAKQFPDTAFQIFAKELKQYQEKEFSGSASGGLDAGARRLERAFGRYREAARQAVFSRESTEVYASFLPLLRWLGNGSQDRHLNLLSLRNVLGENGFDNLVELLGDGEACTSFVVYGEGE